MDSGETYVCACRRAFPGPGPLSFHKRTCGSSKKRLHGALAKAKGLWEKRKKARLDPTTSGTLHLPGISEELSIQQQLQVRDNAAGNVSGLDGGQSQATSVRLGEAVDPSVRGPSYFFYCHGCMIFRLHIHRCATRIAQDFPQLQCVLLTIWYSS